MVQRNGRANGGKIMIEKFEVKDFKCHEGLNSFFFPGMTIVSGTNNSGKSSLLQSLYALTQSKNIHLPILAINEYMKLGSFSDILNREKGNYETVEFTVWFDRNILEKDNIKGLSINFIYVNPSVFRNVEYKEGVPTLLGIDVDLHTSEEKKHMTLELVDEEGSAYYKVSGNIEEGFCKINGLTPELIIYCDLEGGERRVCSKEFETISRYIALINKESFKYLRAYRVEDYKDSDYVGTNGIGLSGEYTAEIVSSKWDSFTEFFDDEGRKVKFSKLFDQWIERLLGSNYRVRSKKLDKNKYKIVVEELEYNMEFTLNQVGFGISQILPILTLVLSSSKGDVILIENPEIHLHPKLQADLVDLFIFALKKDRKIIIETHSEHIVNRARLRLKENNELINKVNIYFFEKEEEVVRYQEIQVDKEGKINFWPRNFFDQSYYDLLGLIEK